MGCFLTQRNYLTMIRVAMVMVVFVISDCVSSGLAKQGDKFGVSSNHLRLTGTAYVAI